MCGGKRMAFLERRDGGGGIGERRRGCQKRGGRRKALGGKLHRAPASRPTNHVGPLGTSR